MLFNSFPFLVLLAVTLPLYYLPVPGRWGRVWQVSLLLVASGIFYAWEEPELLILLGASCAFNAFAARKRRLEQMHVRIRLERQAGRHAVFEAAIGTARETQQALQELVRLALALGAPLRAERRG